MAREFTNRMEIQVFGTGKLMRGTSEKNQKPYHFQEVSFGFAHPWVTGMRCGHCSVDGAQLIAVGCGDTGLTVGDTFDAVVTVNSFGQAKIAVLLSRA